MIGKVPPRLVSLGAVIITIIVLALAVAFYKIPYPISIEANGEVINQGTVQVFVPYKYLYLFDEPRTAHVSLTFRCKGTIFFEKRCNFHKKSHITRQKKILQSYYVAIV